MFGSTTATPPPAKKLANIDADQTATNQQAVPVPYILGKRRIAFSFIAPVYNQTSQKVTAKTGKDQTSTVGFIYGGDNGAAIACVGSRVPMAKLYAIIIEQQVVWMSAAGGLSIGNPYSPVTIDTFGAGRIYAGRKDQPVDDLVLGPIANVIPPGVDPRNTLTFPNGDETKNLPGTDLGHYDYHPAYRYSCYWVAKAMQFGRDRNQVPNEEVIVGRGGPWFTGGAAVLLDDRGCNPAGAVFEALTDEVFGAGWAEAALDLASFTATRNAFAAADYKISVLQSDQTTLRSYLAALFEYGDMLVYRTGTTIGLGYWKTGYTTEDVAALPVIGSTDLTSEPRVKSTGFDDCVTEVNVAFKDREHYFHDAVATYRNPGLLRVIGERRSVTVQRPFITDAVQAQNYATLYGQRFGRPGMTGELDVKLESVEAIEDSAGRPIAGLVIKSDVASLGYELAFRVLECEYPADNEAFCTLTVELERSIWPSLFVQPPPPRIGNFIVDVPAIKNHKVVELPTGLKLDPDALEIAVLAQRPAKSILGFHVNTSLNDVTYDAAPLPSLFSSYALVIGDTTTATTFSVKFYGVDLPAPQSATQKSDYNMLIFSEDEIMALGSRTALGGGVYSIAVLRGLFGTTIVNHPNLRRCFFILKADLNPIESQNFAVGGTVFFKLQPYDAHQTFDLADVVAFTYDLDGGVVIAKPTFIDDYTGYPIVIGRVYDDITPLSVRVRAPPGQKVRFEIGAPVTTKSQFWPWYAPAHGGVSGLDSSGNTIPGREGKGTDMAGFIQSNGKGPDQVIVGGPAIGPYKHTSEWRCRGIPDAGNPTLLGPEGVVTSSYQPVDSTKWPKVPTPGPYRNADETGPIKGAAGYHIRFACQDTSASLFISSDLVTWTAYTAGALITVAADAMRYCQAKRYVSPAWAQFRDSEIYAFANTASGVPNEGGSGGPGGGGSTYPRQPV